MLGRGSLLIPVVMIRELVAPSSVEYRRMLSELDKLLEFERLKCEEAKSLEEITLIREGETLAKTAGGRKSI